MIGRYNQIDSIIIEDLTRALKLELNPNYDEGGHIIDPDQELIKAFKGVLEYYLYVDDYNKLLEDLNEKNST